jgi:hypothetical protein
MKLRYFLNNEGKKIYTLAEEKNNQKTKDAHYKFVKIRDAPTNSNSKLQKRRR